jgi:hypothetical protein
MSNKHTKEFDEIMESKFEPTHIEATNFVDRLSFKTSEEVVARLTSGTNEKWVSNINIYKYCKKYGIEADHDPYDNYNQPELDFKKAIDYSSYIAMQDIEIEGRTGFVLTNDIENKKMVVEFDDNDETKTIDYAK